MAHASRDGDDGDDATSSLTGYASRRLVDDDERLARVHIDEPSDGRSARGERDVSSSLRSRRDRDTSVGQREQNPRVWPYV